MIRPDGAVRNRWGHNKHEAWDILVNAAEGVEGSLSQIIHKKTIEVKDERKSRQTGNFCIEYKQWSAHDKRVHVPSGIAVTKADYWGFQFADDQFMLVPTERIKELARIYYRRSVRDGIDKWRVRETGDNGAWSVLVPILAFMPSWKICPSR